MSTQTYDDLAHEHVDTDAVEVHRHAGLAAAVGVAGAIVAIAWFSRAVQEGGAAAWATFVVAAAIAAFWLRAFVDARTPVLVADQQGVRLRLGQSWHGLPWGDLERVEYLPRTGLLRDGRLCLVPVDEPAQLAALGVRGRFVARIHQRLLGAPLATALGPTTRILGLSGDLTATLRRLANGQTAVVEVEGDTDLKLGATSETEAQDVADEAVPTAPTRLGLRARRGLAMLLGGQRESAPETDVPDLVLGPEPERALRGARRSDVITSSSPDEVVAPLRGRALRRAGRIDLVEETAVAAPGAEPVALVDDAEPESVREPVIGPVLTAARERLGLSIDAVADRTRIRPHVIEAIEVDDFAPCGGDFYARGHLRTLARILGIDAGPLVTTYDERYADAPIDPRRVFEAELAVGTGGLRRTAGGPRWSVLVAGAMAVVLAWSVARLLMDDAKEVQHPAISLSQGSGGPNSADRSVQRVTLKVTASSSASVTVTNKRGKAVFTGDLTVGDIHRIDVVAPVTVEASDAGAIQVEIDGDPRGALGKSGQQGSKTYRVAR